MSDNSRDTEQPRDRREAAKEKPKTNRTTPQTDREGRLAEALKRNIRRRKAANISGEKD
ncbi:MAG: hypothetical protein AAGC77_12130 [Pseudomonadota bacterium]